LALILADTDVLIEYLRGTPPFAELISEYIETDSLQTSCVSCFELLVGARENKRGERVRRFVQSLPVVSLDRESAVRAAAVRQGLEDQGEAIGMADSLIAGIAIANDLELLTRNRKHFAKVEGLRLVSPENTQ
jgi:predicted nucleic acid-binding protein